MGDHLLLYYPDSYLPKKRALGVRGVLMTEDNEMFQNSMDMWRVLDRFVRLEK